MKLLRGSLALLTVLLLACSAYGQTQLSLAEKARHAKELIAAGRPAEAVPIYRELVRALPNNLGLILNLGLALDMSGDKREAIRQYEAALKLDANLFPASLLVGTAYLDIGQPAKALAPLEKAVKLQPEDFDAQVTLAEALLALNRFADAGSSFQKLAGQNPSSTKVWYGLGVCYDALAQQNFDALADAAPDSAYWLDLVAESRLLTKQPFSAFYLYKQALAKTPGMRGVHTAIAEIYRQTGHSDWAPTEEERERQLPSPDCTVEKYDCGYEAGKFLDIVQDDTTSPEALYWKTRAYNKLALDAYLQLGKLPPSMETHELRAKIESKRRQYAQAAKEWREALKYGPGSPRVKRELAIALYQSGGLQEAQTLFEELLKQQPDATTLNYFLGDTLLNSQKPQEAIPYLQKAITNEPHHLPAQRSLGLAYMQTGQPEKAIPHLKEALPIDEDGSLHYQLGRAYQSHGDRDLAREMLKTYEEMHRKNEEENKTVEKEVAITPP